MIMKPRFRCRLIGDVWDASAWENCVCVFSSLEPIIAVDSQGNPTEQFAASQDPNIEYDESQGYPTQQFAPS